jgi:Fic family protein
VVNSVLRKAQFWVAHSRDELNERQIKALNRMFDTGPEGFTGGMTNKKYQRLTGTSPATAQRDLADLVEKGCLVLAGRGPSARYELVHSIHPGGRPNSPTRGHLKLLHR